MLYLNVLTSLKPVSVPSVAMLPWSNLNKSPSDENDIAKISNYIKSGLTSYTSFIDIEKKDHSNG